MKELSIQVRSAVLASVFLCSDAFFVPTAHAQTSQENPQNARENADAVFQVLAATRSFVARYGDTVWPGYSDASFGIILVEPGREILLCDGRLPQDFVSKGIEPTTGCPIAFGPSSWRSPQMLAAMPAFGPPSVIVMGRPQSVGLSLAEWQMILLHEHFHQWQAELPDYYDRVNRLELSGGDETGMWMLNYAFPYEKAPVVAQFDRVRSALLNAHASIGASDFEANVEAYLKERAAWSHLVTEKHWRYAEFQLWQEGIARWTEFTIGQLHPDQAVQATAYEREKSTIKELEAASITEHGRLVFYSMGAVEGMVLEAYRPEWRKEYTLHLATGPLFR